MIAILQFLGTNCEYDVLHVYKNLLNKNAQIIWHKDNALPYDTKLVIIPGGFSYGDYLRCGAIAKISPIMKDVIKYANNGGIVLGICNGFQILIESKLLPGNLIKNNTLTFQSNLEEINIDSNTNKLLQSYSLNETIKIPIANAQGCYFVDSKQEEELINNNQILLSYKNNINGSKIAAICNKEKNIFGMMPHPERACEKILGSDDGISMLRDICE